MHHWTEHNIRLHLFTCVLALQLAHLLRRTAQVVRMYDDRERTCPVQSAADPEFVDAIVG